jgi:putative transposase
MAIADFVRELKKASSVWAAENHESAFRWQGGYSVFSVSASQKQRVRSYIETQEEHHRKLSFRDELESLLIRHEIEFRPEYLD